LQINLKSPFPPYVTVKVRKIENIWSIFLLLSFFPNLLPRERERRGERKNRELSTKTREKVSTNTTASKWEIF
jgi:hypothetical protein